jgi:hypothetical protein
MATSTATSTEESTDMSDLTTTTTAETRPTVCAVTSATNIIANGGFEYIPKDSLNVNYAAAASWTVGDEAWFEENSGNSFQTQYGTQYVLLGVPFTGIISTVTQSLNGVVPGTTYMLTYSYKDAERIIDWSSKCYSFVDYAGQNIDSVSLLRPGRFVTRTLSVTLGSASGDLIVGLNCDDPDRDSFIFDEISLSGQQLVCKDAPPTSAAEFSKTTSTEEPEMTTSTDDITGSTTDPVTSAMDPTSSTTSQNNLPTLAVNENGIRNPSFEDNSDTSQTDHRD